MLLILLMQGLRALARNETVHKGWLLPDIESVDTNMSSAVTSPEIRPLKNEKLCKQGVLGFMIAKTKVVCPFLEAEP